MKANPLNHQCSGEKIRKIRLSLGMTQDKLAAMSNTNIRTIQRAENGASVQIDTVAGIAAALNLTVTDILVTPVHDSEGNEVDEFNAVVLRPTTSGKMLMDMITESFTTKLLCDAEPTSKNVAVLSAVVENLEGMLPNPWDSPFDTTKITLSERLRQSVVLSEKISALRNHGISVYAGTYTASVQIPRFDADEGHMYTHSSQKFEPVAICRIRIGDASVERIVEEVTDKWIQSLPHLQKSNRNLDEDSEVPF